MPYLLVTLLAALLTLWSGAWTWAEFTTITPMKNIDQWEKQGTIDNQRAVEIAWNRLQAASQINPTNADYPLAMGRLALLSHKAEDISRKPPVLYLQRAIARRPSSGLAWTYLAEAIANDQDQSNLFLKAMSRSATLEPYEKLNQQQLIPLAMAYWNRLPANLQEKMKTLIKHGLRYQPKRGRFIVEAAVSSDWSEHLKPLIQKKSQTNLLRKYLKKKNIKKSQS